VEGGARAEVNGLCSDRTGDVHRPCAAKRTGHMQRSAKPSCFMSANGAHANSQRTKRVQGTRADEASTPPNRIPKCILVILHAALH
jgi:hypothetical protein